LFIRDHGTLRKYNIIFVVLAASILVLGWELYDIRQELDNLNSTLKHTITLRTFNFTIVLSRTIISPNFNDRPIIVGEGAAIENVTLVSADDTASTLNISKLLTGSEPLDISYLRLFGGNYVLVDTYGYDFSNILTKSTGPVTHEEENRTIEVTYYTFSGQVDLLYPAYTRSATVYFAVQPYEPFNLTETFKAWHKVVSLPLL
jgi:hypothetical protein